MTTMTREDSTPDSERTLGEPTEWTRRDLLAIEGLSPSEIRALLHRTGACDRSLASGMFPGPPPLAGRSVGTLFFEDSTRTRMSFTQAAQRGGATVIDLSAKASSVNKGETIVDTALTVESMGVDAVVVRSREAGAAHAIAQAVGCAVLNAGDGKHEHPTQALLDAYTLGLALAEDGDTRRGLVETDVTTGFDFAGLTVAIVGDIASSRVARSNAWCLSALGARVALVGPAGLAPQAMARLGVNGLVSVERDFDAVLPEADAVMMLRIQFERHGAPTSGAGKGHSPHVPSLREYRGRYGLTAERAATMKPGAPVLHPGPMNRGVEIDGAVCDGPRSLILRQTSAGVPVRLATLASCIDANGGIGPG
ncbi:MAG: aspartate carbamoyltransferase catalytic subunit [Planctomycetota bacterium]